MIGSSIAHYRITAKLGEGGMGAVYRATDTKLNRDVAIKVLPNAFAADVERLARFTREAQVLASLNHPNIAAIYGVEQRALIMELVEGAPLKGPITLDTALNYARQIADALEAAHEKGVVHRDLKPANVMVTDDGVIKVLDFGLAKAPERAPSSDPENSPTLTMGATEAGLIMGTAGYMAPEQAAGKSVDRRADIWAFGVVLYELLTGKAMFSGETISHTLAHVLTREIDLTAAPAPVRPLLQRCLDRDPKSRLRDIGEARIAIQKLQAGPMAEEKPAVAVKPQWLPWTIAAAALASAIGGWTFRPKPAEPEAIEFQITAPAQLIQSVRFSPDGKKIAYIASNALYVRHLDRLESRKIEGLPRLRTDLAWAPDSARIAVRAQSNELMFVSIEAGVVTSVGKISGTAPNNAEIDWGSNGYLLAESATGEIVKIPEGGGRPSPVLPVEPARTETMHKFPMFFPDGKHFLYSSVAKSAPGIYVTSLDGDKPRLLELDGRRVSRQYAELRNGDSAFFFQQAGQIQLQRFNPQSGKLSGSPVFVANTSPKFGNFTWAVAKERLAFRPAGSGKRYLSWYTRDGANQMAFEFDGSGSFRLSPDQSKVAISSEDGVVWVVDLNRGSITRLTFEGARSQSPVWARDGRTILYGSESPDANRIMRRAADGSGKEEIVLESKERIHPADCSPDGKWMLYRSGSRGHWDLYLLPLSGDRKPVLFVADGADKVAASFSPDGRWISYASNESGRQEIYVKPVPEAAGGPNGVGGRWQVSTENGGTHPQWRRDGKELYYLDDAGQLMAAGIDATPTEFRPGVPNQVLAGFTSIGGPSNPYDASSDGQRFLAAGGQDNSDSLTVVINWESRRKAQSPPER